MSTDRAMALAAIHDKYVKDVPADDGQHHHTPIPIEVRTGVADLKYELLSGNTFWLSVRSGNVTVKCTGLAGETLGEMTDTLDEFFDANGWLTKMTVEEFVYMRLGDKFYD